MIPNPDTEAGGLVKHPMYDGPGGRDLEASHAFASERDKKFYQGKGTDYMEEGTEGQTYPDERREEAQQATLANYYEKKKKHRGPQSGRIGNFGAGTQHPGHTGDSGLFDAYYQNVLGMNPNKKEKS